MKRLSARQKKPCLKIHQTKRFIRCRVHNPSLFEPKSFRLKKIGKGVVLVLGHRPGSDTTELQAILFSKKYYML